MDMNVLIGATIKPSSRLEKILAHLRNGDFQLLHFPQFL